MGDFNLNDYEPVEDRLKKFYKDHPDGRVITDIVSHNDSTIIIKAFLYKNFEDEKPWSTGIAEETRAVGGPVNRFSHVENCETSAIGRALANANYASGKRPSREEMAKIAQKTTETKTVAKPAPKATPKTTEEVKEVITGAPVSRDSNGKTYCKECGIGISARVESYSLERYGRALCVPCQAKEKAKNARTKA